MGAGLRYRISSGRGRGRIDNVECRSIETNDEYDMLKRQGAICQERIIEAKIKGIGR